jgi:molybdopterin converting factor small subunit
MARRPRKNPWPRRADLESRSSFPFHPSARNTIMAVVRIPTPLRPHTAGQDSIEAAGTTVREVLDQVCQNHPALRERIFEGDELRRFVNVYVNNEDIRYMEDLDTPAAEKDEVSIIPAVAGG